jgi:hypothetical protein
MRSCPFLGHRRIALASHLRDLIQQLVGLQSYVLLQSRFKGTKHLVCGRD